MAKGKTIQTSTQNIILHVKAMYTEDGLSMRQLVSNTYKFVRNVEKLACELYEKFDDRRRETERLAADREDTKELKKIEGSMRKIGRDKKNLKGGK